MRQVVVGVLGVGVVGAGVLSVLSRKRERIASALGAAVLVKRALVRDLGKERGGEFDATVLTTDADAILDDAEIEVVVELLGGEEPARRYIERALTAGKHVVTANKEVIAKHGRELLRIADERQVNLFFEASVGGGIPIIRVLRRDLVVNEISQIQAIINGTTNFILSEMESDQDYRAALRQAQVLGYAEADPRNDVEGVDAAYKLAILATLAFRTDVRPDAIHRAGITQLEAKDFRYAREMGYVIKLLATARAVDGEVEAAVHPTLLPMDHHLASVKGVFNAVLIDGDEIDKLMLYGRGAGAKPTSSAVLADVSAAVQDIVAGVAERVEFPARSRIVRDFGDTDARFYLRLLVADEPGVLAQIARVLGDGRISIASCIQKETDDEAKVAEIVIMTHTARQRAMTQALDAIAALPITRKVNTCIRVGR
ncbi:MAG TPA: homoserine dehydrogenase [Chloroflexota bacterium]|jgi:homoserine dehydrogenase|nr:homoserine dehydrogenase [Chloroflexota bacterium]